LETLQSKLKEACASREQQNEAITNLVSQCGDLAKKFNDSVQAGNDVVAKCNDPVKEMQSQSGGAKQ
jgi:hypothetical protein